MRMLIVLALAIQVVIGGGIYKAPAGGGGGSALSTYLIADWEQQEAANTNATDATGNGHTGTQNGNINTATGPGGSNASRDYDQNFSEYFSVADHADLSMGDIDFCLETHVYLTSTTGVKGIIGKNSGAGNVEYWMHYNGGSERFNFSVSNDGTASTTIANTVKPSTNTWYHLVGCHAAGAVNELRLYVNGTAMTPVSHTTGVVASGTAAVQLGALQTNFYLPGRQAFTRIYKNYLLTSSDVTWLYNSGTGRTYSELTSYVP
jgi:hypothetical protein